MKKYKHKKSRSKKSETYIDHQVGEPGKPDPMEYSPDLITFAISRGAREVKVAQITYDPPNSPERLFRRAYEILLPPDDEQHPLYDRDGEINRLSRSALKYFTENQDTSIYIALYELAAMAIGHASSIYTTYRGEDEKTTKEYRPNHDVIAAIEKETRQMKKAVIQTYGSGGDRRPKVIQELWNDENCKRFARKVDELHGLWKHVKDCFDPTLHPSPAEWLDSFKQHDCHECQAFQRFYNVLHDDLLTRVANTKLRQQDREPLRFACLHAARELGLTVEYIKLGKEEPDAETLRQFYYKGVSLL